MERRFATICGASGTRARLNPRQTAKVGLDSIYPTSNAEHAEYGGFICMDSSLRWFATTPGSQGSIDSVNFTQLTQPPPGAFVYASYHTHPYSPSHDSENFSALGDKTGAFEKRRAAYVATPSGAIKFYLPLSMISLLRELFPAGIETVLRPSRGANLKKRPLMCQ